MPEPATKTEGQEPEVNTQPGAAPQATGQEPGASNAQTKSDQTYTEDYVKDLRKEAASYRTKFSDAQKRADSLQATLDAMNLQNRESNTRQAIAKAAADAVYTDVVTNLLLTSELKLDEQGNPDAEALKGALETAKKNYPALFKSQPSGKQIDAGAGGQPAGVDFNSWLRGGMGIQ